MCPCESKRRTLSSEKSDTESAGKCVRQMVVKVGVKWIACYGGIADELL